MPALYPSLMAADPLNLGAIIKGLEPYCAGFHLDIMDGHYVPNIALSPQAINAIAATTTKHLWLHCMVDNPLLYLENLNLPAGSLASFHIEKNKDILREIKFTKERKWQIGIAISPKTPIEESFVFLDTMIDNVLVMAVEPGFSGQKFIPGVREKIIALKNYRTKNGLRFTIGVDGGVDHSTIASLVRDGADTFALGSAIFAKDKNPVTELKKLQCVA